MMPTDHIALACAVSVLLIRKKVPLPAVCLAAISSHYALDLIPHAEPSMLGASYLVPGSVEWRWAAADNGIAFMMASLAWFFYRPLHNHRFLCFAFLAWVPDSIEPAYQYFHWHWLSVLGAVHASSHFWWRHLLEITAGRRASPFAWDIGLTTSTLVYAASVISLILMRDKKPARLPANVELASP